LIIIAVFVVGIPIAVLVLDKLLLGKFLCFNSSLLEIFSDIVYRLLSPC